MKTFKKQARQGDVMLEKVASLPEEATEVKPENGQLIIAHSETGHNHAIRATPKVKLYQHANDNLYAWLVVKNDCLLEHHRSFHTHETIKVSPGIYKVRRQREHTPEGWRRAID